jgi:hypothetical protein
MVAFLRLFLQKWDDEMMDWSQSIISSSHHL